MQIQANPPTLTRYGAILTALLSGVAALAVGFAFHNRPDAEIIVPGAMQKNAIEKNAMASQIEYLAESARLQAQAIAAHPQTLACFEAGNGEACRAQAANLHALNREATLDFIQEGKNANLLPGMLPEGTRRLLERGACSNAPRATTAARPAPTSA